MAAVVFMLTFGSLCAVAQAVVLRPATPAGADAKLVPRLRQLATPAVRAAAPAAQAQTLSLPAEGPGSLIRINGGVVVTARVTSTAPSVVQSLRAAGAQIETVSARYAMITFAVAPADLGAVAAIPAVLSVQPELRPLVAGDGAAGGSPAAAAPTITCPWGAVRSEGDTQLNAANARSQDDVDGAGVTVGVISDSFDTSTGAVTHASDDVASGDLPGTGNPCGFASPVGDLQEPLSGGADEGRAMAQVVHDLAPGASLDFASGESSIAGAVNALRTAGANVIVDDLTALNEPFFQDGPDAVAADDAAAAGIPYFSAAGNDNVIVGGNNVSSWEAPSYRPTACPPAFTGSGYLDCMDFDPGAGTSNTEAITLAPGGHFLLDLQWNEPWFGVQTDLDVYLFDASGNLLAGSANNNPVTQMPFEAFSYKNPSTTANQTVFLAIGRSPSPPPLSPGTPRLKYVLATAAGIVSVQFPTSSGGDVVGPTIFGHNGASGVMSIAAVPFSNSSVVEPFSSRGPVTHYYGPVNGNTPAAPLASPEVLSKPDAAATDGAATTFFAEMVGGVWRFFGTSEAAPHAAAIAALELELDPSATARQVDNAETSTAQAIGTFTSDADGHGLLNAASALGSLLSAPLAEFTSSPSSAVVGSPVSFDGTRSSDPNARGSITSYSWDFGDGQTGSGARPSHTYTVPGTYTVELTVTDNYAQTGSVSHQVSVANPAPPTAAFTSSPASPVENNPVSFDATSSSDPNPNGSITNYSWDFGDGQTGSGATPSHTYTVAGTYTVKLTVTDNYAQTSSVSHDVTVNNAPPPTAAFTFTPASPLKGNPVSFDATNSSDPNPSGAITSYSWDFGDGQAGSGVTPSHTYAVAGTYTVKLTVKDNFGKSSSVFHNVIVNNPAPPTAAFISTPASPLEGNPVSFDATGSSDPNPNGAITTYSWDFGDGQTGSGVTPSHTYTVAGTYTVTLTVTDNYAQTSSVSHQVSVANPAPPTAAFTSPPASPLEKNPVSFDATSSSDPNPHGAITTYAWDFGDGQTGSGATPSHTYTVGGTYTVKLTVTDNYAQSSSVSHQVIVRSAAPPAAAFTSSPLSPLEGSPVLFDATGSSDPNPNGSITTYAWSFGDGGPLGAGPSTVHTFAAGSYTVKLTITDNYGKTNSVSHIITVADESPTASFTAPAGVAGVPVVFSGSGADPDGFIIAFKWSFGDGTTATGANVAHTYAAAGTYGVTLTVTDIAGKTASVSHTVAIRRPPPPPCRVPNVRGKSLAAARKAINAASCTVGKVTRPKHKPKRNPGKHKKWAAVVSREAPAAGSTRPNRAKINLTLVWKAIKR